MAKSRGADARPIHNRVNVLRAELQMSRAELAERVGVNPQTIGALERGDHYPSLQLAMSICEVFDLPIEERYTAAIKLLGIDPLMLATEAGHA